MTGITSDTQQFRYKKDTPITLAIPLLFQYGNCSSLCTPDYITEYGFHLSSQQYNVNNPGSVETHAISSACSLLPSPQATDGPNIIKDSHSYDYHLAMDSSGRIIMNLCYLCENKVFGIHFNIDNPTFSMIVFLFGHEFNQSFAALPLPSVANNSLTTLYHYDVLFGTMSPHTNVEGSSIILEGITIQTIYDNTNITIEISSDVVAVRNAKHRIQVNKNRTKHFLSKFCAQEVLWMEPMVSQCITDGGAKRTLSGTRITSNKPIMVFTNKAKCNNSRDFSYKAQLVHQMPERKEWGTRFILDTQQVRILPKDSIWMYNISVLISHHGTHVSITYHYFDNQKTAYVEQLHAYTDGEILHSAYSNTILETGVSHIDIHATNPVLVTYDFYTVTKENNNQLSYSILLQPIEWYNNIQTVVLSHPNPNLEYKYHISVVVPKNMYDPKNILISKGAEFCETAILHEYNEFSGQTYASDDYIVLYLEPTNLEVNLNNLNETQLLVRHSNSKVALGVTVFAYSQGLHYGYSNGYSFSKSHFHM